MQFRGDVENILQLQIWLGEARSFQQRMGSCQAEAATRQGAIMPLQRTLQTLPGPPGTLANVALVKCTSLRPLQPDPHPWLLPYASGLLRPPLQA